jgi:hypothetical protein
MESVDSTYGRHTERQAKETTTVTMNTYVNFAGTCAEAFRFYEKHLGGKIGHARIVVGDTLASTG